MQYQVWAVYDKPGLAKFFVVNRDSKEIQSTWKTHSEAKQTCDRLNSWARQDKKLAAFKKENGK